MSLKLLMGVAAIAASGFVAAQTPDQPRLLASNCASCHGTDGHSQGGVPALAGTAKVYLVQQLRDFKTGKRDATLMHQLVKGYTDAEIDMLAAFFAAQKN